MDEERTLALLVELHRDTPRQGPGSRASTLRALSLLPFFDSSKTILDLGCGGGAQTACLFEGTDASIVAVDLFETFVEQTRRRFVDEPEGHRVRAQVGDMFQLDLPIGHFDMIWSEGALYIAGIERAIELLTPLLADRGHLCFTELSWLDASIPTECREYWTREYPGMKSVRENCEILERGGFSIIETFPLELSAWLDEYYGPLRVKIPPMRKKYEHDLEARGLLDATLKEIQLFERFHDCYNYVFYLARHEA